MPGVISEADWECFWRVEHTLGGSKMELSCRREANFAIQARIETASMNFDRLGIVFGSFWELLGVIFAAWILRQIFVPLNIDF